MGTFTNLGATKPSTSGVIVNIDTDAFAAPVVLGTYCYQGNATQKMILKERNGLFSGIVVGTWDASALDLENLNFEDFSDCASNPNEAAKSTSSDIGTGWMQYSDTQYTEAAPFVSTVQTDFVLPNNGSAVLDIEKPSGVTDLYDSSQQRILATDVGNGVNIRIDFDAISTQQDTEIDFSINIGGAQGKIFPKTVSFNKSAGEID
ncbi:MAG: hypothetical protein AAF599_01575, partial [Bacteroidota bacterium]